MKIKSIYLSLLCVIALVAVSCDDTQQLIKDPVTKLSNDCIKRTLPTMPNIVGEYIEFAYGMATPNGRITTVTCEASIPGDEGTYFDPNSYNTDNSGKDVPVLVCNPSTTSGSTTTITACVDTCAMTMRYYYKIPESARGKKVSFVFTCNSSANETAQMHMGPYVISKMDMSINQVVKQGEGMYLTFHNPGEAVHVYSQAEIEANPSLASQIDLVYGYNALSDITHAFYNASAPAELHPDIAFPSGFAAQTKMMKDYRIKDRQLIDEKNDNVVDDLDFEEKLFEGSQDYCLRLGIEYGIWVETADGMYRAFINIKEASAGTMKFGVKRYAMK